MIVLVLSIINNSQKDPTRINMDKYYTKTYKIINLQKKLNQNLINIMANRNTSDHKSH